MNTIDASDITQSAQKIYSFEELLSNQGYLIYTSVGTSMLPLIRERRDVIEIRAKSPNKRCNRYDVVLFKGADKYILHRVLKVREKDYIICGDHNVQCEIGVTDRQILGVMTRLIRNGKQITPSNKAYKLYVHLWCDFFHIRVAILYSKMIIDTGIRKIKCLYKKLTRKDGEAD